MPVGLMGFENLKRLALLSTVFLFYGACSHPRNSYNCTVAKSHDSHSIVFTETYKLNAKLEEVSGISMDSKGLLWCVNDEEGVLYQLDSSLRTIAGALPFGPPGDYEGLAIRNDTAYVIRSDATVFEFALNNPSAHSMKKIQRLPAKCETESVATYNNSLFTICKQQAHHEKFIVYKLAVSGSNYTAVEAFDWTGCISDYLKQQGKSNKYRPSDLYFDNKNKRWVMCATKPASLVFFNEKGNWLFGTMLNEKDWPQPEGICQLNDSSYVLTSESKGNGIMGQFKVE